MPCLSTESTKCNFFHQVFPSTLHSSKKESEMIRSKKGVRETRLKNPFGKRVLKGAL